MDAVRMGFNPARSRAGSLGALIMVGFYSLVAFPSQISLSLSFFFFFFLQVPDKTSTATPATLMILGLSQTNARDNLLSVTIPFTISSTMCRAVTQVP